MPNISLDDDVKKHVAAIHIQSKYSLLQRKLSNVLLANAYDDLQTEDEFDIPVGTLADIAGFNSNDREYLKTNLIALASTPVFWNILEEEFINEGNEEKSDPAWTVSPMFEHITLDGGRCTYSYNRRVKQRLADPVVYAKFSLAVQRTFTSSYGLALYENCIRYKNIGKTKWFPLETFRKLMGVEKSEYKDFKELNRRVIKKAVEEVNTLTDIEVVPSFHRVNRKVDEIQFSVKRNPQYKLNLHFTNKIVEAKEALIKELEGMGVTHARIVVTKHHPSFIRKTIDDVLLKKAEGKIKKSVSGLIFKILSDTPEQTEEVLFEAVPRAKKNRDTESTKKDISRKDEEKKDAQAQRKSKLLAYIDGLSEKEHKQLLSNFEFIIKDNELLLRNYKKQGLKSPIVLQSFLNFIEEVIGQH